MSRIELRRKVHRGQMEFSGYSVGKESTCNIGDLGSILELGRSLGEGNVYPLQYSCLESRIDRGAWRAIAWWATVHGVTFTFIGTK